MFDVKPAQDWNSSWIDTISQAEYDLTLDPTYLDTSLFHAHYIRIGVSAYVPPQRAVFTKNPGELRGEFTKTQLEKSPRGFGFTILGEYI